MNVSEIIIMVPVILFSLTIHEFAHGWAALKCGDDTARSMGRLTLDPFKHLDPLGTIMMIGTYLTTYIPFGWAKPVPIDPRFFNNPKRDITLVSLAGPLSNLIVAVAAIILAKGILIAPVIPMVSAIYLLLYKLTIVNVCLAIFNMLPFAPLDGSKIIIGFLPDNKIASYLHYSQYAGIAFIFLLIAESVLKIKTISYVLDPIFGHFFIIINQLFMQGMVK